MQTHVELCSFWHRVPRIVARRISQQERLFVRANVAFTIDLIPIEDLSNVASISPDPTRSRHRCFSDRPAVAPYDLYQKCYLSEEVLDININDQSAHAIEE